MSGAVTVGAVRVSLDGADGGTVGGVVEEVNGVNGSTVSIVELPVAQGKVIRFVSDDLEAVLSMARVADDSTRWLVLLTPARALPGDLTLLTIRGALILAGLFFKGDCFIIIRNNDDIERDTFLVRVEDYRK